MPHAAVPPGCCWLTRARPWQSRILANAIVGLLSVVGRAGLQAWRQAIISVCLCVLHLLLGCLPARSGASQQRVRGARSDGSSFAACSPADGQKAGISPDAARPGVLRGKGMELEEALKVLNVEPGTPWPKVKEVRGLCARVSQRSLSVARSTTSACSRRTRAAPSTCRARRVRMGRACGGSKLPVTPSHTARKSQVVRAYERLGQERGEDVSGSGGQQQQSAGNPFGGFAASGVPREGEDRDSGDQQKQ